MDRKITVVGAGYTGLSNAVLLAQKNDVTVLDIDETRVQYINNRKCPFKDKEIDSFYTVESLTSLQLPTKAKRIKMQKLS